MLKLFDLLGIHDSDLDPRLCKIHLATWNGFQNPLNVFFDGKFEHWQAWQSKKNFKRAQVLSLVALPGRNRWLFVGTFNSLGCKPKNENDYWYTLEARPGASDLVGRVVVSFNRSGRQAYLNAERWCNSLFVDQVLPQRMSIGEFPGFTDVRLTQAELELIVNNELPSWKSALGSVGGIYVIADKATGSLYVGSATGEGGFWSRWSAYSRNGHGGNKALRKLIRAEGDNYALNFQYSILETSDTKTGSKEMLVRESHWKEVLRSRDHGYNEN